MGKIFEAQSITRVRSLSLNAVDDSVKHINVKAEINLGTLGITETVDVFPLLTPDQDLLAQAFYDLIYNKVHEAYGLTYVPKPIGEVKHGL